MPLLEFYLFKPLSQIRKVTFRFQVNIKCKIVICYYSQTDYIDKIQKVISIIGKDELIKRVHGSNWLIKFVSQYSDDGVFEDYYNMAEKA